MSDACFDDDVEINDLPCPACGNSLTHFRRCYSCEDGTIDMHEEDPVNYAMGEEYEDCPECHGRGDHHWRQKCNKDYEDALHEAMRNGRIVKCGRCNGVGDEDCDECWGKGWVFTKTEAKAWPKAK